MRNRDSLHLSDFGSDLASLAGRRIDKDESLDRHTLTSRGASAPVAAPALAGRRDRIPLRIVLVKPAADLAAEISRIDVFLEQRAGAIFVVAQHTLHHFHY